MHTLIAVSIGLVWFSLAITLGRIAGFPKKLGEAVATALWLVACVIHGGLGVAAGYSVMVEFAIGILVFLLPYVAMVGSRRLFPGNLGIG
jgi:fatty acid desaturase